VTLGPHLLGRVAPPDTKHLELHPYTAFVPEPVIEVEIKRPTLSQYDQGNTPHCVSYSASKVMNWFNKYAFAAEWLYKQCKLVDGMPGVDGTNARAACDVLRRKGHWRTMSGVPVKVGPRLQHGIESNTWATSVNGIRTVFAQHPQPVLIGIDWYEAWFEPSFAAGNYWMQDIVRAGGIVGGHEIGIWACSDKRQAFGLSNTWGSYWPSLVWLPYAAMSSLFADGADACVIQDLATR
jgi:hypothetical protein